MWGHGETLIVHVSYYPPFQYFKVYWTDCKYCLAPDKSIKECLQLLKHSFVKRI